MGREIRRVPPNWQHPKKQFQRWKPGIGYVMEEDYQPMYDEPFAEAMREWIAAWEKWEAGDRDGCNDPATQFWEWYGSPPDPEYYRPDWPEGSATWFQLYQTVSEGAPVSPPFATIEELAQYLAEHGDFWDQSRCKEGRQEGHPGWGIKAATQFCKAGWAPSLVAVIKLDGSGQIIAARDGGLGSRERESD